MSIERYEPVPHIPLRTFEAIAAYANPTRMAILSILAEEEATLSMVAARLGTAPANLSHHIRKLLESRLIVLIDTRATAKNVEKFYRASAYAYSIDRAESEAAQGKRSVALEAFRDEIVVATSRRVSMKAEESGQDCFARVMAARIKAGDFEAFRSRLEEVAGQFEAKDGEGEELVSLALALFRS